MAFYTGEVEGMSSRSETTYHVGITQERVEFLLPSHLILKGNRSGQIDDHGVAFREANSGTTICTIDHGGPRHSISI